MGEVQMTLSVAILLSEVSEVKEISAVFRKLNIIPHYYEDLSSFWKGTLEKTPALCVVDVKCMSDGELVLRDHPFVKTEEMPLLFYYTELTEPLLYSTFDLFNLGNLKKTTSYEGPLKSILKRLNRFMELERENYNVSVEQRINLEKIQFLELNNDNLIKEDSYRTMAADIANRFSEAKEEADFFQAVEKIFNNVEEFLEFSLLELSFNGQKLISPISYNKKFRMIPSIWLGQSCNSGIEVFAQNMATQIAMESMDGQLVSLLIKGQKANPDKIIFIKSKDELFFNAFDWNLLESFLSGLNAIYELKLKKEINLENNFTSTFEAMNFLDQFLFGKTVYDQTNTDLKKMADYRLISVDLADLVEVVLKKGNQRFFWNKFYQEFNNKLELQTRINFKVFSSGVTTLAYLVEAHDLDMFFNELKSFSSKFFYWKYFENSDGVLGVEIKPKVAMVPLSSYAFLQATKKETAISELNKKTEAEARTKEIIWGRDTTNEV
jgi:hypothetical protein